VVDHAAKIVIPMFENRTKMNFEQLIHMMLRKYVLRQLLLRDRRPVAAVHADRRDLQAERVPCQRAAREIVR
jgi:hypothetical protein